MTPSYWKTALKHLSSTDPTLALIIGNYKGEFLKTRGDAFYTLARSIAGQQISVKAADSVWAKLVAATKKRGITPESILALSDEQLRACGLSGQKVNYLRHLATFFQKDDIHDGFWDAMEDEEAIAHITQIKGIGRWTAEMFLIFHLQRPDVFPIADLGLQKAILRHYPHVSSSSLSLSSRRRPGSSAKEKLDSRLRGNDKKERGKPKKASLQKEEILLLQKLAESWRPYRSVATWYLWRALDPLPVEY